MPEWNKEILMSAPCFVPLRPFISRFESAGFPTLQQCNALLASLQPGVTVHSGKPLHFVSQEYGKLPFEAQYEPRCYLQGEVPTRANNWHDLFNALVWLAFPRAKAAINARHYRALTEVNSPGTHSQRGAVRDTSTLLDESGVLVVYSDVELANLLRNFQWKELFWKRRAQVRSDMGFYLFGHGLYEKSLQPYIGMTGQGLLLPVEQEFFHWGKEHQLKYLDVLVSDYLSSPEHCNSTRELTPVPLLGVPGWAAENENAAYYDNTDYFRTGRHGRRED
ncbi:putative transmembrane protein [Sideroxydans lithotrophicus ES-1]|uniref:Putative transmembrane protein n=2 Tax=Sideroxydans TaxID=314343 RepID=D5CRT4_SIDLE|nr:putative transmembrane protein [Sideroxydans lithotrophicus ES-1]